MYSKTDGTFSTDANGNKTYTDAAGVTTTQCDEYNYTDEMAILLPMDTAILIHIQVLTSISDTDDGNIAQFRL